MRRRGVICLQRFGGVGLGGGGGGVGGVGEGCEVGEGTGGLSGLGFSDGIREGGLMSYGPGMEDSLHQAALYIDRILKGTSSFLVAPLAADAQPAAGKVYRIGVLYPGAECPSAEVRRLHAAVPYRPEGHPQAAGVPLGPAPGDGQQDRLLPHPHARQAGGRAREADHPAMRGAQRRPPYNRSSWRTRTMTLGNVPVPTTPEVDPAPVRG